MLFVGFGDVKIANSLHGLMNLRLIELAKMPQLHIVKLVSTMMVGTDVTPVQ